MVHFYGVLWPVTPVWGDLLLVIPTLLPHLVERKVTSTHHLEVLHDLYSLVEPWDLIYKLPSPLSFMQRNKTFYAAQNLLPLLETRVPQAWRVFRDYPFNCLFGTSYASMSYPSTDYTLLGDAALGSTSMGYTSIDCVSKGCVLLGCTSMVAHVTVAYPTVACSTMACSIVACPIVTRLTMTCSMLARSIVVYSMLASSTGARSIVACSTGTAPKICAPLGLTSVGDALMNFDEKYVNALCLDGICLDRLSLKKLGLTEPGQGGPRVSGLSLVRLVASLVVWSPPLNAAAWPDIWSPPLNDAAHPSSGLPFNPLHYLISKRKTPRVDGFSFTPNAPTHIQDTIQHLDMLVEHGVRLLIGEDDYQAEVEWNVEVNANAPEPITRNVGAAGVPGIAACNHSIH